MEDQDALENVFRSFPTLVSFSSPVHTPSQRRLSSSFTHPRPPVPAARRLAWVSLQGRLVNAEQASSVRSIRGSFGPDEAIAWQLFSPIERFLIVAVIGVAVSESKKNHQIGQLQRAVELRVCGFLIQPSFFSPMVLMVLRWIYNCWCLIYI